VAVRANTEASALPLLLNRGVDLMVDLKTQADADERVRVVLRKRVDHDFTYHAPKDGQPARYEEIRGAGRLLAKTIVDLSPPSREASTALLKVEEAVMHANAAIARHG